MLKKIIEAAGMMLGALLILGFLTLLTGCAKPSVTINADPIHYDETWWVEYIYDTCQEPRVACTKSHLCEQPLVVQLWCEVEIHNESLR